MAVWEGRGRASGRVNLIGEHTDYNQGWVLPLAIPLGTEARVRGRGDREVRVSSAAYAGAVGFTLGAERRRGDWVDYVAGTTALLAAAGFELGGFDAAILSDLPPGAGLASSAALVVALLRALVECFGLALDALALARLGQRVETEFVGAPTGIMDQMAACFAGERAALLLDTRSLDRESIPLPEEVELIVVDSRVTHGHAGGDYGRRNAECAEAAALLGVASLREVEDVASLAGLPEPLFRRARHVVTENARVLETTAALRAGDLAALGPLFAAAHASFRDDFEASVPAADGLVAALSADPAVIAARLTGGGFGGAVIGLAHRGRGAEAARRAAAATSSVVLLPRS